MNTEPNDYSGRFWLEASALEWLRYDAQCVLVMLERGLEYKTRPDVWGVKKSRFVIEIECKRTVADFKADQKKYRWWNTDAPRSVVWQLYYMVTPWIVHDVQEFLPKEAGLMTLGNICVYGSSIPAAKVIKRAAVNPNAERLSVYQIARCIRHQGSTLQRMTRDVAMLIRNKTL